MKEKSTEKEVTTLSTTRLIDNIELFVGNVVCPKCGQAHSYEGIEEGCKCTNCSTGLEGELF